MARFQTLPDRIDCICVSIPDSQLCLNHGAKISCNLTVNCCTTLTNIKQRYEQTVGSSTFTVPAGICQIFIEMWGAGGGGAGPGNCCCCSTGTGGSAGAYAAIQITTTPGCQYTVCAASGGSMGCNCSGGFYGNTSYVNGYNLSNFCATGGAGGCSGCNTAANCYGINQTSCSLACVNTSCYQNNAFVACGEGGHVLGKPQGCRFENKGGSAPFNGGIGEWNTYNSCCPMGQCYGAPGGGFPGGGAAGAPASCCCGQCNCGGCGAAGFVRIWY